MPASLKQAISVLRYLMERISLVVLISAAVMAVGLSMGAAIGLLPWIEMPLQFGETLYPAAGMYLQLGLTALFVALCFFLPGASRVMQLEHSHRKFHMSMQDVAAAYHAAHSADREGVFLMSSEFDSVRERLIHLRQHPQLSDLEPEILEIASQMSHLSQELADIYSDEKVERARTFLKQRQEEVDQFNARVDRAKSIVQEIKYWAHEIELEESVAVSQMERLREELDNLMPSMGVINFERGRDTVIEMEPRAAE